MDNTDLTLGNDNGLYVEEEGLDCINEFSETSSTVTPEWVWLFKEGQQDTRVREVEQFKQRYEAYCKQHNIVKGNVLDGYVGRCFGIRPVKRPLVSFVKRSSLVERKQLQQDYEKCFNRKIMYEARVKGRENGILSCFRSMFRRRNKRNYRSRDKTGPEEINLTIIDAKQHVTVRSESIKLIESVVKKVSLIFFV